MMDLPEGWKRLLASWSDELLATTHRVEQLIGHRHAPSSGSYREVLLRRLLRRVLPDRYRVSTGFIYRWQDEPSLQHDVLIWDAQEHAAVLEEGEFVILTPDSVSAIIEVKATYTRAHLRECLDPLHPTWLHNWRYQASDSSSGLQQQLPDVPLRAIFFYTSNQKVNGLAHALFAEISAHYSRMFAADAERALGHKGGTKLRWLNILDAVCIADRLHAEQTSLTVFDDADERVYDGPGLAAFPASSPHGDIAVGRFCLYMLQHLGAWSAENVAELTLKTPWPTTTRASVALPGWPNRQNVPESVESKSLPMPYFTPTHRFGPAMIWLCANTSRHRDHGTRR